MTAHGGLGGGVAVRVSALCLDRRGRPSSLLICSAAIRAALLLDLALTGRVTQTEKSVEIDATPTGFAPADRLLMAVVAEPDRPLDSWLDERRLTLRDVVEANVTSGRWRRRRIALRRDTYDDLAADVTWRDRSREPTDETWLDPRAACVTAVAAAAGLLDRRSGTPAEVPEGVLTATGGARWLAEHTVSHLTSTYWRYWSQASALRVGDTIGPG